MPGYLSHLAARVSGARPAVRPRIPSIFESTPGTALAVAPDPRGLRVVEEERVVIQPPAPPPAAAPASAEPPLLAHISPKTVTPERHPSPHAMLREDSQVEGESADRPARTPRSRSELRTEPADESAIPQLVSERVAARLEATAADPLDSSRSALPQPAQRAPQPQPDHPRAEVSERLLVRTEREEPRLERRPPEPERTPTAPQPTPQAVPFAPQPEIRAIERFPAFNEPAARQAPSVQVTIGRLIVEAVAPTPAAAPLPAPRPHAPRLSLDDYLRQRRSQA